MSILTEYGAGERQYREADLWPERHLGRVVSQYTNLYRIVTEKGDCLAEISGKLRYSILHQNEYPAVGDFVLADRAEDVGGNAVIQQVLPRHSLFTRRAVGTAGETQVVAANIDTVFLCMPLNLTRNPSRMERYLSVAWDSGAVPVVLLTKADLCDNLEEVVTEMMALAPGTDVVTTSDRDGETREKLLPYLGSGQTVAFIGPSGVGKSTLINLLMGGERMETGAVRQDGKGRHTTTRRELLLLPSGAMVIDTPGMRELGADSVDLSKSFADIDALADGCRFGDCTHTKEPGCAVLAAVQAGTLDLRRLENYRKLKREARYDGLNAKQLEQDKLNGMFREVGGMKNVRKYIRDTDKRKGE